MDGCFIIFLNMETDNIFLFGQEKQLPGRLNTQLPGARQVPLFLYAETQLCIFYLPAPQTPATARLGRARAGGQELHMDDRGPSIWAICCCLPRSISRKLSQKRSWDSNQYSDTERRHSKWWLNPLSPIVGPCLLSLLHHHPS